MFDSNIPLKDLIEDIRTEADIAPDIPNRSYVLWANSLEQLLYSEIIHEPRVEERGKSTSSGGIVVEPPIMIPIYDDKADKMRFEDIYAVYADNIQLIHTNYASGGRFLNATSGVLSGILPNSYCKYNNELCVYVPNGYNILRIHYYARPALKTVDENDNIGAGNVMLPIEFIDLMRSKLRGEAYKIANEDALAAKWLNDYNAILESFKAWISKRETTFGI